MKKHTCRAYVAMLAGAALGVGLITASVALAAKTLPNTTTVSQTGVLVGGGGGGLGTGPDLGPDDPISTPRAPGQPYGIDRTSSSVQFEWKDNSSWEQGFNVYRGTGYSGPWTRIATLAASSGNAGLVRYTDSGLPRDAGYYYRIGAYNAYGESFSLPQVLGTIDGRKVSRLRLRLRTANVTDAGTDDSVHMSLHDQDNGGTWLDYGRDDFERGDDFTYELSLDDLYDGISDLSEIHNIYLLKPGDDGWCIESLALIADTLNGVDQGVEIFNKSFGTSTCRWLDGQQNYLVIGRDELRAHPLWQAFKAPLPPLSLHRIDLERRIEGMVGDILHDNIYVDLFPLYQGSVDASWTGSALDGDAHVRVSRKDATAVHVNFEIDVDTPGPGGLTGDLSFDLRFAGSCRTATAPPSVTMTMESVAASADFDWITEAVSLWLINLAEDTVADRIRESFPNLSKQFDVGDQTVSCVTPAVADDGSVDFGLTFATRTTPVRGDLTGTLSGATLTTATPTKAPISASTATLGTFATKATVAK